ncbi:MAG TPA: aminomethyl-transferring glycine dehydrogenase subunit GcvPA [Acidimicrobiia bacterium]|nr:aminomethyl-transferring glycine dehydrogenase subunit GcvPA [Acidimicrobiia bacterium]
MGGFVPHTPAEIEAMLGFLGLDSLDDLFAHIPEAVRLAGGLAMDPGRSEADVLDQLEALAGRNRPAAGSGGGGRPLICFAGGGAYEHDIPSAVRALAGRSEFVTSYTPYQPELAQGVLQALFEYQTMLCRLTGMEVANASLYDAASAAAEGLNLAAAATGRRLVWLSAGVRPAIRSVIHTLCGPRLEIREAPLADGVTAWPDDLGEPAALLLAHPNHLGALEDVAGAAQRAHAAGGLLVAGADPVAAGLLRPVGELGADVMVGEGQPLGTPLAFGGPYVGLFAVKQAPYVRRWLPGRLVGEGTDSEGRKAYVLTLSTREQHIRRAGASSNVCTNQTLIAVTTAIHLAWLGPAGLREMALRCARGARYTKEALVRIPGVEVATSAPTLYEFAVRTSRPAAEVLEKLAEEGFLGGLDLSADYPDLGDALLVTVTETRTKADIDAFVTAFEKAVA